MWRIGSLVSVGVVSLACGGGSSALTTSTAAPSLCEIGEQVLFTCVLGPAEATFVEVDFFTPDDPFEDCAQRGTCMASVCTLSNPPSSWEQVTFRTDVDVEQTNPDPPQNPFSWSQEADGSFRFKAGELFGGGYGWTIESDSDGVRVTGSNVISVYAGTFTAPCTASPDTTGLETLQGLPAWP